MLSPSLDRLLIDEFGFDRLEREAQAQASTVYYRLLDAWAGRRSTALATNIDFKAWADYLGNPPLARLSQSASGNGLKQAVQPFFQSLCFRLHPKFLLDA